MSRAPVFAPTTFKLTLSGLLFGALFGAVLPGLPSLLAGDWVSYTNDTDQRLVALPGLGALDPEEKDFAWGDLDQDGDIDLVCVRKQPFMQLGRRRNVLFLNEGLAEGHPIDGILVDRTEDYVTDANDGGQGFLDLTSDRDVQLVDVNGDGWLDMVTSATFGQGLPKTISHPRVYVNKGAPGGTWLGFIYEEERTPTMPITPKFCGLAYGDVTGEGSPDLYFIDYENDLEDRLWINDGTGHFTDQSVLRMTYEMRESEFGVFCVNADLNGDGANDIVKCRSNGAPYRISIAYNDPSNEGFFTDFDVVYTAAPYYIEVGDLNDDGLLDLFVNDDDVDRYLLNQGNGPDGLADFSTFSFPASSDGFGGRTIPADLDNDGFLDIMQADATLNGFGCDRHLLIFRNDGNVPNVAFSEETGGIPLADRQGTWDVAPIDLDQDGWLDLVIGTCDGISIWMAEPPAHIEFVYPEGRPTFVPPGEPFELPVDLVLVGVGTVLPSEAKVHYAVNGGPFVAATMAPLGGESYLATLPAVTCLDHIDYYFTAGTLAGGDFADPPGAPSESFSTVAAAGTFTLVDDPVEGDVSDWIIISSDLLFGEWEQAVPIGTVWNGSVAAPDTDASGEPDGQAFVTENGLPGGAAGDADIDGGPTTLMSPLLALAGADAYVSFDYWLFSDLGVVDSLEVAVSNDDGANWTVVESVTEIDSSWRTLSFLLSDHLPATDEVRVRFSISDNPNDSISEGGLDNFRVEALTCGLGQPPFVRGDCNGDGSYDIGDAVALLGQLFSGGEPSSCADACDGNDDGALDVGDVIYFLSSLFSGGAPPLPPHADCGEDPTSTDPLDCMSFDACP